MRQNQWMKGKPELAARVSALVAEGYNRREISEKLKISRYMVDRLVAAPSRKVAHRCEGHP